MNRSKILRVGQLLLSVGGAVVALVFALLDALWEMFGSVDVEPTDNRRLHDAEMIGEYNHRTRKLDAGTDPYGWYDED